MTNASSARPSEANGICLAELIAACESSPAGPLVPAGEVNLTSVTRSSVGSLPPFACACRRQARERKRGQARDRIDLPATATTAGGQADVATSRGDV